MPFGTGGPFLNRPYAPKQKRRGRPPGRPTENLRFSETRPVGAGGTSRTPSPTKRDTQCRERASTVPQYTPTMTAAPRRTGTTLVGRGRAARPTVRIPYAERILATGRAVLLDCRQVKSIRHEFVSGHCPPASPVRPQMPRRSGNLSPYLRCFCGQIPTPIGRLRGRRAPAELRRW